VKRVAILGSTGSIGTQTLDVIANHPERLRVVGLAARSNACLLKQQAERFGVTELALFEPADPSIPSGMPSVSRIATLDTADLVVVAVSGVVGLLPTLEAIKAGKHIALASKEVLVAAGEIVMPLVRVRNVDITPIDSEHSAVFQCLQGYRSDQIGELILTASGGPFRGMSRRELQSVSVEQALNHPTWRMGGKITIDSATLMNKGLEMIEARWLFDVGFDQVNVVVHPQSIVHSLVRLVDGSVLAQCGWPDMRLPIQVALLHPERAPSGLEPWDPLASPQLTFEPVDEETFPCPGLARRAARIGGTMPCAMNAANEEAANAFLRGEIAFLSIPSSVEEVMSRHSPCDVTLESLLEADGWARRAFAEVSRAMQG
jgi:1-deoxy-D-xylulose-5-phosphate reductoisomerase